MSSIRPHLHAAADWAAEYLEGDARYPVMPLTRPGDILAMLPDSAPTEPETMEAILADFERVIVPGVTQWNHPAFFAYFAISASGPGVVAELLTAALNVNGMLWRASPSVTELEQRVLDWLRQLMGLEASWFGMITDTASMSTMLALACGRELAAPGVRDHGLAGRDDVPRLRVYCSEHAHSSVDKAAVALGIGLANVIHVPVDGEFRMRPEALDDAIRRDRSVGMAPAAVVATTGTTSTASVDPVRAIAAVCRAHDVWLHVDAAYGGSAAVAPELRWVLDGAELADSLVVNPHKWLFTPLDLSALYTRRPDVLRRAFSLVPEYLATSGEGDAVNYMDYGVQLGRRFRALKLWFVLRAFGSREIAERIRAHCALAREVAGWIADEPGWVVCAPVHLSLVCFRYAPPGMPADEADRRSEHALAVVNASGRAFLSHTRLDGRYVLRLAIGNLRSERMHVEEAWQLVRAAAAQGA